VLTITGGGPLARRIGFAVPITAIKTSGVVRRDQTGVVDRNARNVRKVDMLLQPILDQVLARTVMLFE